MASFLHLPVILTKSLIVRVANGANIPCQRRFEEVSIQIQEVSFSLTLYSLSLTGFDLLLGIQWLELLGSVVCNWKQLTMEFTWANHHHQLVGVNNHQIQAVSHKDVTKCLRPRETIFAICIPAEQEVAMRIDPNMQTIISNFADLFTEPSVLPPQ